MIIISKKEKALSLFISLTAFFWMKPYFQWNDNRIYRIAIVITIILFIIVLFKNKFKVGYSNFIISILLSIGLIYFIIPKNDGVNGFTVGMLVMVIYILANDGIKQKTFYYFGWIFALSLIPGILIMILSTTGFNFNSIFVIGENGREYRQYLGAVALTFNYSDIMEFRRLHGMFDEPGVVGTFAALLLVADKFKIYKNYKNIIILIGGLFSLSFAFFAISFIYIVLRMNIKFTITIFISIFLFISFFSVDQDNLDRYLFERIVVQDGTIAGDNRITNNVTKNEIQNFYSSNVKSVMLGKGNRAHQNNPNIEGSSWHFFIYDYGIIGALMFLLFLYFYYRDKVKINRYHCFLLLILFILSVYQRPLIINLQYMIVLFGGIANLQFNNLDIGREHENETDRSANCNV